jgi:peptidyl-prolyl cis-trans isomerase B (cyclophilin B)
VASTKERQQRAAARARLARQMAERQAAARRRRRVRTGIAAGVGLLLVVAGTFWVITSVTGDDGQPIATASPSPTAVVAGNCTWLLEDTAANPNLMEVGTPPAPAAPPTGTAPMTITTDQGVIEVEVDAANAPCTYTSLAYLAGQGFYNGSSCHRITTEGIFVLQCGDPTATGEGGPTYKLAEENLPDGEQPLYPEGTVAMAKAQPPSTTGSQFFIVYADTELSPDFTVVGTVTEGLDIVKEIAADGAIDPSGQEATDGAPRTPVVIETMEVGQPEPASTG